MERVFDLIRAERLRQQKLHGEFNDKHSPLDYHFIAVILEELGEATQVLSYIKRQPIDSQDDSLLDDYIKELVQTGASVVAVLEKFIAFQEAEEANS